MAYRFRGLGRRIGLDGNMLQGRLREAFLGFVRRIGDATAVARLSGDVQSANRPHDTADGKLLREVHPLGGQPKSALAEHAGPLDRRAVSKRRLPKLSKAVLEAMAEARRKTAPYPPQVRAAVVAAVTAGLDHAEAARHYGVSPDFVASAMREHRSECSPPGTGAPPRVLEGNDDVLFLHAMENPKLSLEKLAAWLQSVHSITTTRETVRRSLVLTGARPPRPEKMRVPQKLAGHFQALREKMLGDPGTSVSGLMSWLKEVYGVTVTYGTVTAALAYLGLTPGPGVWQMPTKLGDHRDKLQRFRHNFPDRTLEECRIWLRDEYQIHVTRDLVGIELRRMGLSPNTTRRAWFPARRKRGVRTLRPAPGVAAPTDRGPQERPDSAMPLAAVARVRTSGRLLDRADEQALADRIRGHPSDSWEMLRQWLRDERKVAIGRSAFANALARLRRDG